ncbi:MAG: hypothetical protein HY686_03090 [Chloroflexi bacterium]|nr:hypothetical protein [Chloroflexota bacterium]
MPAARISIMLPSPGHRQEVEHLLDALEEFVAKHPGYIMGFRFNGAENKEEVGRVSLWASDEEANRVAMLDHTIALRARLHRLIEPGHVERLVIVAGNPKNLPKAPASS